MRKEVTDLTRTGAGAVGKEGTAGNYSVVRVQGDSWMGRSEPLWAELLSESRANKLFSSWPWLQEWWASCRDEIDGESVIMTAEASSGALVGILPLYIERIRVKGLLRIDRLQLMGNSWTRSNFALISQYMGPIVRTGWAERVLPAFAAAIHELDGWDELCLQYVPTCSPFLTALRSRYRAPWAYIRSEESVTAYHVDTSGNWRAYLAGLKAKPRRRLYNQRTRLASLGGARLDYADTETLVEILDEQEALQRRRWGSPSTPARQEFCRRICAHLLSRDQLRLSRLKIGSRVVSSKLNARVEGTEYNLRLVIDDEAFSTISPGFLHLGLLLEAAFDSPEVARFDLLAGRGKHTQYKATLATAATNLESLQIVRYPPLMGIYKAHDALYGRWRLR